MFNEDLFDYREKDDPSLDSIFNDAFESIGSCKNTVERMGRRAKDVRTPTSINTHAHTWVRCPWRRGAAWIESC